MLDQKTRTLIADEVRKAILETLQATSETWLTGDSLQKHFEFFTKSWLKSYGHLLPRTQIVVEDDNGVHRTSWCYPKNKISQMILDGSIKKLKAI